MVQLYVLKEVCDVFVCIRNFDGFDVWGDHGSERGLPAFSNRSSAQCALVPLDNGTDLEFEGHIRARWE